MAKPLKILSLDGGGIRGISSLLLLESIMEKVRETEKLDHDIKPSQYFDLIGGTSTGGIIAIMLGRLDMTVRECINAYKSVAEAAFTRRPRLPLPAPPKGEYSATALVEAFKSVIRKYCQDPQCVAQREGSSSTTTTCPHGDKIFQDEMCCETVVLAITKGNVDGPPTLFKTYDKATRFRDCTVWQVARATSAATTFFESIQCGLDEIDFIDAGFGYNNPCEVLIEEAKRRHPDNAELHILSIGTGLGKVVTIKDSRRSILDALKTMSSSSSKVARSLETKYRGSDTYFRFNVEKGLEDITLSDWHETSKISSHTHNYLLEEDWKIEKYARVTSRVMELASGPLPGDRITITQEEFANKVDDLHSWLNPVQFELELTRLLERRASNSQNYLLDESVGRWSQSPRGLLQITGDTGYGKTMAAATLIERASSNGAPDSFIGYAFCLGLNVNTILRSIIWQIVQHSHLMSDQKLLILNAHRNRQRTLTGDHSTQTEEQEALDLPNLVAELLQSYKSVTLVFDGIDRIRSREDIMVACILKIADPLLSSKSFKLIITSRFPPPGLQRVYQQLGLYTLGLTTMDVTHDAEIYIRQSLGGLEPPLDIDVDQLGIPECLDAADQGWPDVLHALATKYVDTLGRPNEAEGLVIDILSFREARQQEEPILHSKRLLAWIMVKQGRQGEAEALQRSLLETARQTRGDEDALVKTFTNDLSVTLLDQEGTIEQKREAITLLERLHDAWQTPEGEETEKSLSVLNNLAVAYMLPGIDRFEEAEALLHRGIHKTALLFVENGEESIAQKINLARAFSCQRRWPEAEALHREVLEIRRHTLGMDHPNTIQCLSNLGWDLSQQEDRLQEARTIQSEVMERRIRVQGARHPDTIGIIGNLAKTLAKLGQMGEARRYARMALGY